MNIILIEDEAIAMRMLRKLLLALDRNLVILAELDSVADSKKWFAENKGLQVDVVFSDIQLTDGLSFEIFESMDIQLPIIFTTAYNEYAIRAFKVNGVDYLLKPINEVEVQAALNKLSQTKSLFSKNQLFEIQQLMQSFQPIQPSVAPSFLAYQKEKIIPVRSESIAWVRIENQVLTVMLLNGQKLHLEETMDSVEKRLPKAEYFKINRQYIVSRKSIVEAEFYFNNRLSLKLNPIAAETVVVSRERVSLFRNWLQGIV